MKRRAFLHLATLAAPAMVGLAACGQATASAAGSAQAATSPAGATDKQGDAAILNGAIDLEHQAIWTYNAAAGTKLLQKPVLDLALIFKGQHEQHRDALSETVRKLGGTAATAKATYDLPALKNQTDILNYALKLEDEAAHAYLEAVSKLSDKTLAKSAASVGGVEAEHAAILRQALGQSPVPQAFLT